MSSFKTSSKFSLTALSVAILAMSATASAGFDENIENALKFGQDDTKYGQIKFDLRYRYEQDDSKKAGIEKGDASTIRLRLGYLTPEVLGFQAYAEYETNQDFGANTYDSTRNGKKGEYQVIADPQEHELNQFWLSYKGLADTQIKVGRQRIKLDNDRFIGNVGWRQMEMTYDSVLITNTSLDNTTIKVGYINQAQTIKSYVEEMETPFVNIAYNFKDYGKLTGYTYLIDNNDNHNKSNQTFGVSFNGGKKINDNIKALYRFEYAFQQDYQQNVNEYEADYFHVVGGANVYGVTVKAGMEQLDGSGKNKVFQTPLATGHAFNGWSDQFLTTPNDGLRDVYASLSTKVHGVKIMGVYHDFADDTGSMDYGKEWDFLVTKKFGKHYSLLAKYAYFDADTASGKEDTQNFWLQAGVSF